MNAFFLKQFNVLIQLKENNNRNQNSCMCLKEAGGQQISHQICCKLLNMLFLVINFLPVFSKENM